MASRSKKCAKKSPLKQSCASQCVLDTDDASSVDTVISSSTDDSGALDSVPYRCNDS